MIDAADLRYEIKMVCEERAREAVMAALNLHHLGIRKLYPPRQVQSLYFDTPGCRALEDNIAGINRRSKIRFRWYGSATQQVRGSLERKIRGNNLGRKDVLRIDALLDVLGTSRAAFHRTLLDACEGKWRQDLGAGLEITQWISYEREYLITGDRRVRITVDRELRSYDQRFRMHLSQAQPTPLDRVLIVECKAPVSRLETLDELVRRLPLKPDKCSKYVLASAQRHGPTVSRLGW